MIDELAIQQNINRYSEGASRSDWDQVITTFMPDGIWEIPVHKVKFHGHADIKKGLAHFSADVDYMLQVNAPAVITITGDTATARSVIREGGKCKGRNEGLEVHGLYADKLARTPDGWKFVHRIFELRGMFTYPLNPPPQG